MSEGRIVISFMEMSSSLFVSPQELYRYFLEHPSVCTDSRKLKEGDIFVALKGENFDGNDYALKSLELGASYAVVSRPELASTNSQCLLVEDTLKALQGLALEHRKHLNIPVVAITGTNGKTTTKELTNAVLSQKYRVLATEGNLNNHIGVPLTILKITQEHEVAIIEMGASAAGEIELLASIARPTLGLITNIGKAHLKGFGSQEGILNAKGELFEFLESSGGAYLLNGDDPLLMKRWQQEGVKVYALGDDSSERYVAGEILSDHPYLSLSIQASAEEREVHTHLVGKYNYSNVLAAAAVGIYLGVNLEMIKQAIEQYVPSNNRSQLVALGRGIDLILDCYNANPSSMRAALENLQAVEKSNKLVILGDMLELGEASLEEHQSILGWLNNHPNIEAILVGNEFGKALVNHPNSSNQISYFSEINEAQECLESYDLLDDTVILVKGSRGIALEKCAPFIEKAAKDN